MNRHTLLLLLTLMVAVALSACGAQVNQEFSQISSGLSEGSGSGAPAPAATARPPEIIRETVVVVERESAAEALPEPALPATDGAAMGSSVAEAPGATGAEAPVPMSPDAATSPRQAPEAAIKAGEINDNERINEYLDYLKSYQWGSVRLADVSERYEIRVLGDDQRPLLDARVTVYDGERVVFRGRTYAGGKTLFMPRLFDTNNTNEFRVVAEYGQASAATALSRGETERIELGLRGVAPDETLRLDLLFLLDTTGSMGDELARIQETIDSIAARIDAFSPRPEIRYGLVAYKDVDDEYVTRPYAFTTDLDDFRRALAALSADGGGDTPEALDEALYEGMVRMEWRDEPTVRLAFLVADAGSHVPGPSQFTYLDGTREAVARGVKIYPIAASNTDPQAEYVFRQLAQQTMAGFVFLTYQPGQSGGAPGESTTLEAGEQSYTVERLDDLIVGIVERELGAAVGLR
jgi:Mg-chelatase subunit ChlD